jgi:hypothetical protein
LLRLRERRVELFWPGIACEDAGAERDVGDGAIRAGENDLVDW